MNHAFRIVWNRARNCYVVACEFAKSSGKGGATKKVIQKLGAAATVTMVVGAAPAFAEVPPVTLDGDVNWTSEVDYSIERSTLENIPYVVDIQSTVSAQFSIENEISATSRYFDGDSKVVNDLETKALTIGNIDGGNVLITDTGIVYSGVQFTADDDTAELQLTGDTVEGGSEIIAVDVLTIDNGSLENRGEITAEINMSAGNSIEVGSWADVLITQNVQSVGIKIADIYSAGSLINSGTITSRVTANAFGDDADVLIGRDPNLVMLMQGFESASVVVAGVLISGQINGIEAVDGSIQNSGNITAEIQASAEENVRILGGVVAGGVLINGAVSGSIDNTADGNITALINATAVNEVDIGEDIYVAGFSSYGIDNEGSPVDRASLTNQGSISASIIASAGTQNPQEGSPLYPDVSIENDVMVSGVMLGFIGEDGEVTNTGVISASIDASAFGEDADVEIQNGVQVSGVDVGSFNGSEMSGTLRNEGSITALIKADTDENVQIEQFVRVDGIAIPGALFGQLTNAESGRIDAKIDINALNEAEIRNSVMVSGIDIGGVLQTGKITNDGSITASIMATAGVDGVTNTEPNYPDVIIENGVAVSGISAEYLAESAAIENTGNITAVLDANSFGGDADVSVGFGVRTSGISIGLNEMMIMPFQVNGSGSLVGEIQNSGNISAQMNISADENARFAENIGVYGIQVSGVMTGAIMNTESGEISASLVANDESDNFNIASGVTVAGLRMQDLSEDDVVEPLVLSDIRPLIDNSGTIAGKSTVNGVEQLAYSVYVDNGLDGQIVNQESGLLYGALSVNLAHDLNGTTQVINNGVLDTRYFDSNVAGTYEQSETGMFKLGVRINPINLDSIDPFALNDLEYGRLTRSGTITLAANTAVRVTVAPDLFGETAQLSDILEDDDELEGVFQADDLTVGGELVGDPGTVQPLRVTDNYLPLNFVPVAMEPNSPDGINLQVVETGLTTVTAALAAQSFGGASDASNMLDDMLVDPDQFYTGPGSDYGNLNEFLYQLGSSGSSGEVAQKVSELLPLMSGGVARAAMGTARDATRLITGRLDAVSGRASGDQFFGSESSFWLKPFGSRADQGVRDGVGFDAKSTGIVLGVDNKINPNTRLGIALGLSSSDIDRNGYSSQTADVDSQQLMIYGDYAFSPSTDTNFYLGLGWHEVDGRRTIGDIAVARSSYDSQSVFLGADIGWTNQLSPTTKFRPSIRADFVSVKEDGYTETGAGDLSLTVGSERIESFLLGVDGKISYAMSDSSTFTANLGAAYDLMDDRPEVTASLAGVPDYNSTFVTQAAKPSDWLIRGGVGITGKMATNFELSANLDLEWGRKFDAQALSFKARWLF